MRALLASIAVLSLSRVACAQSADYRGYELIEESLSARLLVPPTKMDLSIYSPAAMLPLLGGRDDFGAERPFRNGLPNAVNLLIYYMDFSGFATDIAGMCGPGPSHLVGYRNDFQILMNRLCSWPDASAQTDDVMQSFWIALMGYDAPLDEYQAWHEFFLNSSYRTRSASETVHAMTIAITLNPYFLLRP